MYALKHIVFGVGILFVILNSEASIRKIGRSSRSLNQEFEEAYLEAKQHRQYDDAYAYIQELSSSGNNEETDRVMLDGLNVAIDFIRKSSDDVYDGLKYVNDSIGITCTKTLTQSLETTFSKANADIINAGAQAYLMLGTLTELSGAYEGLNKATQFITRNGDILFSGYNAAKALATQAISAGKHVPFQGVLAALKAVQSTEEGVYVYIDEMAQIIYDALYGGQKGRPEINETQEEAAQRSPECLDAIKSVQLLASEAKANVTSQIKNRAINVILDGFVDTLKSVAAAAQPSYTAIDAASKIQKREFGTRNIENGFAQSNEEFIAAISIAQQYLGIVYKIIGPEYEEPIIKAMVIAENGRIDLLKGQENSKFIAYQGIRIEAAENALIAARYGIDTALFTAYGEIIKSAKLAMNTIVSATI